MKTRFREDKATQAACIMLERRGGRMSYMKLIKLLYLADRRALTSWGHPITYDSYVSMDHGPVLSFTYDRIKAEPDPENSSVWHRHISEQLPHYEVELRASCEPENLSEAEGELINQVFDRFGHLSRWQLRDLVHDLPEWKDPEGSMTPIKIHEILEAEDWSQEEIEEAEADLDATAWVGRILR